MQVNIDEFLLMVVRIEALNKDESDEQWAGYGTGFFYTNDRDELFLITNRHVVRNEDNKHFPTFLRLRLHTDATDYRRNREYDVPLYNKAIPLWKEPMPFADVVAIRLDVKYFEQNFLYRSFRSNNLLPDDVTIRMGEDVLVIGYPLGEFYDYLYNLPVIRAGIISSAYPVPYRGNPYFLVDSKLHKGTSGSPVVTKFKNVWEDKDGNIQFGKAPPYLLGINSSTYQLPPDVEPLGLNSTIFASKIVNLTSGSSA